MRWEIIPGDEKDDLNQCLSCGHKSKDWAERIATKPNEEDETEPDGCNKVFCPKCKYYYYYCA